MFSLKDTWYTSLWRCVVDPSVGTGNRFSETLLCSAHRNNPSAPPARTARRVKPPNRAHGPDPVPTQRPLCNRHIGCDRSRHHWPLWQTSKAVWCSIDILRSRDASHMIHLIITSCGSLTIGLDSASRFNKSPPTACRVTSLFSSVKHRFSQVTAHQSKSHIQTWADSAPKRMAERRHSDMNARGGCDCPMQHVNKPPLVAVGREQVVCNGREHPSMQSQYIVALYDMYLRSADAVPPWACH